MATQKVYETPGSVVSFKDAALSPTVVFTPKSEGTGKGRISAQWDRGAGPQPARYKWRYKTKWAATPAAGDAARLYLVTSDGTDVDGGFGAADAELTGETELSNNCTPVGAVISVGANQAECSSGVVEIHDRYVSIAVFNGSATKAFSSTAGDHVFTLTPVPDDIQAMA